MRARGACVGGWFFTEREFVMGTHLPSIPTAPCARQFGVSCPQHAHPWWPQGSRRAPRPWPAKRSERERLICPLVSVRGHFSGEFGCAAPGSRPVYAFAYERADFGCSQGGDWLRVWPRFGWFAVAVCREATAFFENEGARPTTFLPRDCFAPCECGAVSRNRCHSARLRDSCFVLHQTPSTICHLRCAIWSSLPRRRLLVSTWP